jgi:hypothetical protein
MRVRTVRRLIIAAGIVGVLLLVIGVRLFLNLSRQPGIALPLGIEELDESPKPILNRLDGRIAEGFGDYVAVATETHVRDGGQLNPDLAALNIYARNGKAALWVRYLAGESILPNGRPRAAEVMSLPEGWPLPALENIIERAKATKPGDYTVTDGKLTWPKQGLRCVDLAETIWRGRGLLLLHNPGAKARLLADVNRPDLVGIYAEGLVQQCDSRRFQRTEQLIWIDPGRDDVPVETFARDYGPDGETVVTEFSTKYLDYGQLPDGKWYPNCWRQTTRSRVRDQFRDYTQQFHLRLYPGTKLHSGWFCDPQTSGWPGPDPSAQQ